MGKFYPNVFLVTIDFYLAGLPNGLGKVVLCFQVYPAQVGAAGCGQMGGCT